MSACCTPERLSFSSTVTSASYCLSVSLILLADSGRRMVVMNFVGKFERAFCVSEWSEEVFEETEARMPVRIAVPSVPRMC